MTKEQRECVIDLMVATILEDTHCPAIFGHLLREGCVGFKYMDDQQLQRAADCWDVEVGGVTRQLEAYSKERSDLWQ